jgi:hypothetical protein
VPYVRHVLVAQQTERRAARVHQPQTPEEVRGVRDAARAHGERRLYCQRVPHHGFALHGERGVGAVA